MLSAHMYIKLLLPSKNLVPLKKILLLQQSTVRNQFGKKVILS